jgi:hypothetical protein
MLAATTHTASAEGSTTATTDTLIAHRAAVHHWRGTVRHRRHRAVMLAKSIGVSYHPGPVEMRTTSVGYLRWMAHHFAKRDHHYLAVRHRLFPKLRCIHSYEGSWDAYNAAGPYYGGFQMDASFMEHWGADKLHKYHGADARSWSVHDQMAVASRAVLHIGFSPWPNTAAMCGL